MDKSENNIRSWIPRFIRYLQVIKKSSTHTIAAYENDLVQFADYLAKRFKLESPGFDLFNKPTIRGWLALLVKNKVSSKSIARKLASLRSFSRFLLREQVIDTNPVLNIASPRLERKLPHFLAKEQVEHILLLPDIEKYEGLRDLIILELFYATGIRVSELSGIRLKNINFEAGTLRILGKGNKQRIVPVGTRVLNDLKKYIIAKQIAERKKTEQDDFLFVKKDNRPFTRQQIAVLVKQYIEKIAGKEKAHPHTLRHTFATHLLDEGADLMSVKELLGHSNLTTTQIYTHVSAEHLKRVYKQAHPRADDKASDKRG